ncbi:MAG: glycine cleavage system protein GcvH [Chloroflexi bacterium]|jgi:glycine cleavage system H protein|nr:glycine cleavage system protein GcvH [Chloroflexota bacterium]
MNVPSNLKYAKSDEWVSVEGNVATIGISDFAQDQLSDVVFVEINVSTGDELKKDTTLATLESVKAAADVNAPVSGKVLDVNESLSDSPEVVNSDPYGKAWMVKVELSNPSELDALMDATAYEKHCEERSH